MQKSWFEKDKKNDASNGNEDLLVIIIKLLHTNDLHYFFLH